jgi:hypothetical protein
VRFQTSARRMVSNVETLRSGVCVPLRRFGRENGLQRGVRAFLGAVTFVKKKEAIIVDES